MDLLSEIRQSGAAMRELVSYFNAKEAFEFASSLNALMREKEYKRVVFTGMGSSHYAAFPACQYLHNNGIEAQALESGELLLYGLPRYDDEMIIAISQSGHSAEVIALLESVGREAVTVTNYPGNRMYDLGMLTFPLCAGPETKSSSKSYTNTLAALMYISFIIAGEDTKRLVAAISNYADNIDETIAKAEAELGAVHAFLGDTHYLPVIGGGPSYATASQAEILIMEISRIISARYTCGQFMHGTIELLDDSFRAIVLDFQERTRAGVDEVICETLKMGGKVWLLTNRHTNFGKDVHATYLPASGIEAFPLLSPIIEIEPIILYTAFAASKKGLTPGLLRAVQK